MSKIIHALAAIVLTGVILAGCATTTPSPATPTIILPTDTKAPPTETPLPTHTLTATLPPSLTPTLEPTQTLTPANTDTPTPTLTETPAQLIPYVPLPGASKDTVSIYFIQIQAGSGSCNDRVIAVSSGEPITGDIEPDIAAGLRKLFSYKDKYYGDLYNPLYASSLRVQKVDFKSSSGELSVYLSGTYKPSGEACDNQRVRAQVWTTIKQFRAVKSVTVFLNRVPFGDRLSNDN